LWSIPVLCLLLGHALAQEATKADEKKKDAPPAEAQKADVQKDAQKPDDLWTLERLFSRRGFTGPVATNMAFAQDGKHAAYLWRPYAERNDGADLWLLDVATGKSERVTSLAMMTKFQASARAAKEAKEKRAAAGGGEE